MYETGLGTKGSDQKVRLDKTGTSPQEPEAQWSDRGDTKFIIVICAVELSKVGGEEYYSQIIAGDCEPVLDSLPSQEVSVAVP